MDFEVSTNKIIVPARTVSYSDAMTSNFCINITVFKNLSPREKYFKLKFITSQFHRFVKSRNSINVLILPFNSSPVKPTKWIKDSGMTSFPYTISGDRRKILQNHLLR